MPDGAYEFHRARNFTPANRGPGDIIYIVIHDMEAPEDSYTTAEGVGNYFAGPNAPRGSTHYGVDRDSVVQYVEDHDVAWGAPNVNHNGLHFEHAGYARQSREEWLDPVSLEILRRSAPLTRRKALAYGIPLRHCTDDQLRNGEPGFIGHADASRVLGGGDHWDPGPEFPWDIYMQLVGGDTPTPTPVHHRRDTVLVRTKPGTNRVDVFAIGSNGNVLHAVSNTGADVTKAEFAENLKGDAVSIDGDWVGEWFILAAHAPKDNRLYYNVWNGTKWGGWAAHPHAVLLAG